MIECRPDRDYRASYEIFTEGRFPRVQISCAFCGNKAYCFDRELIPELTIPTFIKRVFVVHENEHAKKFREMQAPGRGVNGWTRP